MRLNPLWAAVLISICYSGYLHWKIESGTTAVVDSSALESSMESEDHFLDPYPEGLPEDTEASSSLAPLALMNRPMDQAVAGEEFLSADDEISIVPGTAKVQVEFGEYIDANSAQSSESVEIREMGEYIDVDAPPPISEPTEVRVIGEFIDVDSVQDPEPTEVREVGG